MQQEMLEDGGEKRLRPEPLDIVLIVLVGLLLFGANRFPETARALGKGIRELKDALAGDDVESRIENENMRQTNSSAYEILSCVRGGAAAG
jgi:TatA/E family protein of Tat protein translocase